jgi:hypothetical protein
VPPPAPPPGRTSYLGLGALSLDASVARSAGGASPATAGGALASIEYFSVSNNRLYDGRTYVLGALGYGGGQVEGELRGDLLYGVRGYFSVAQGPFLRGGWVSHLLGNASFSTSYWGFAGESGYEYMTGALAFEVGVQGGGTLRGSVLVGGFATLAASEHVFLRSEWQRFYETSGAVVDEVSNRGCVTIRRIVPICLAVWSETNPTTPGTFSYAELSVGLGGVFTSMTRETK